MFEWGRAPRTQCGGRARGEREHAQSVSVYGWGCVALAFCYPEKSEDTPYVFTFQKFLSFRNESF
jgi:hypothetical protein